VRQQVLLRLHLQAARTIKSQAQFAKDDFSSRKTYNNLILESRIHCVLLISISQRTLDPDQSHAVSWLSVKAPATSNLQHPTPQLHHHHTTTPNLPPIPAPAIPPEPPNFVPFKTRKHGCTSPHPQAPHARPPPAELACLPHNFTNKPPGRQTRPLRL
jgi:hypothetical protein